MSWIPGWDSIEGTGFWSHFWFWFGIACLFALGAAEVVSHLYSLRKDELVAAAQRNADDQRKRDADEADAGHKADVAALQDTLAKERTDRLLPRAIKPEQRAAILACLEHQPKGPVFIRPAQFDAEATAFSTQIEQLLREAQFEVRAWPEASLSWSIPGAFLIVLDLNNAPSHASAIQSCFGTADIALPGYTDKRHPADSVSIAVGARP